MPPEGLSIINAPPNFVTPALADGGRGNSGERKQQHSSPNSEKTNGKPDNQTGQKDRSTQAKKPTPEDSKPKDPSGPNERPWQEDPRKYVDPKGNANNPSPPKDYCPAPIK
jgi:hypothetical protein